MLRSPRFCYTKTRSVLLILIELFLMMVPREDPFLLRLMDFRIGKNPWTDGPVLEIYEVFRIDQLHLAPILRLFRVLSTPLRVAPNLPTSGAGSSLLEKERVGSQA